MVLVSIILGLGITKLLRGLIASLSSVGASAPGLIHSIWVLAVWIAHVHLWALRWGGEQRGEWPGFVLFSFLLLPSMYYALAEFLFPPPGRRVQLDEYFLDNRLRFFILMSLVGVAQCFGGLVHYQQASPLWVTLVPLPGHAFLAVSRKRGLHLAWAALNLLYYVLALSGVQIG